MNYVFIISLIYISACVYLIRGGGGYQYTSLPQGGEDVTKPISRVIYNPMNELRARGYFSIRNADFAGLILTNIYVIPFAALYYHGAHLGFISFAAAIGYTVGATWGWGNYFDMGGNANEASDGGEVYYIDWICFKIFGPKYSLNPAYTSLTSPTYFDCILSPTGDVRPFWHRFFRDYLAYFLRLNHFFAIFACIGAANYIISGGDEFLPLMWALVYTFGISLAIPPIYGITANSIAFHRFLTGHPGFLKMSATNYAEFFAGAIIGGATLSYINLINN